MPAPNQYEGLLRALREAGVRVNDGGSGLRGFPVTLRLAAWPPLVLDLPEPPLLALFDPAVMGIAVVDANGMPRARWGLAERLAPLSSREALQESAVGALVEDALLGESSSAFLNGVRYYACAYAVGDASEVILVVADAIEETMAREVSKEHQVSTLALKRIGKALSSKQSMRSLALSALHAIYGTFDLSAAFLWVKDEESGRLALESSIGTSRGLAEINRIKPEDKCIANIVSQSQQTVRLEDVFSSPVTANMEAQVCGMNAGPSVVLPLLSAKRLIGVLELVAKKGDETFGKSDEIFETIAEHLALAIHNAMMFEEVERLAMYDPLTGIANHRTMQEFLAQRISEAARNGEKVAAVMIDVDHFRRFNEEEGHDAGDEVLKLVAGALKGHVRGYDLAARYGGEEFTLILSGVDRTRVVDVAERVRGVIEGLRYESRTGESRPVTASFGCAVYPDSALDAAGLLKAADQALYEAKRGGRNRTVLYQGGPKGQDLGDVA